MKGPPKLDTAVLKQTLLSAEGKIQVAGGWDQPDYLFALRGSEREPEMEYVLQVPEPANRFLTSLLQLGLVTSAGVLGLVLVGTSSDEEHMIRCLMAVLCDGTVAVLVRRACGLVRFDRRLPAELGDHDEVVRIARQLMRPPVRPPAQMAHQELLVG